jgi:DNA-binding MarR family transcriptional regulator
VTSATNDRNTDLTETAAGAWRNLLVAHSRLIRALDAELRDKHNVTLGDFDVMVQLWESKRGRLRMNDIAEAVVLSPSGLSRRVDRLERAGLVKRTRAKEDARNVEASLTPQGKRLFQKLRLTHRAGVNERFASLFSEEELETLRELLRRVAEGHPLAR